MKFRGQIPMLDFTGINSNNDLNQHSDEVSEKVMIFQGMMILTFYQKIRVI